MLVRVDSEVYRLVAHADLRSDLLGAPFGNEQLFRQRPFGCVDTACVTRISPSELRETLRLSRPIAFEPDISREFATDRRLVPADYLCDPRNGVPRFQQSVNLVTFILTEMLVCHRASSTGRSRKLRYANILSHLNQLIDVALRI